MKQAWTLLGAFAVPSGQPGGPEAAGRPGRRRVASAVLLQGLVAKGMPEPLDRRERPRARASDTRRYQ